MQIMQLVDTALVPDPDADQELAASVAESLSEDEIAGARMRLFCKTVETIEGGDGVAVALTAEFHPAPATRFTHANIVLRLVKPDGTKILALAPVEVKSSEPVSFKVTRSGTISFEKLVKAELGAKSEQSYSVYPCVVRGSGETSRLAMWSFEEYAAIGGGIGQSQDLMLTLAGKGPFAAELIVSARLLKPGIAGALQRVRDLILGPDLREGKAHTITLPPPVTHRSGLFAFLG